VKKLKFVEIGEGQLYLGTCGQKTWRYLSHDLVKKNRPPAFGSGFDSAHFHRYDGTSFFQWFGRTSGGYWKPYGKILKLTKVGS